LRECLNWPTFSLAEEGINKAARLRVSTIRKQQWRKSYAEVKAGEKGGYLKREKVRASKRQ